MSQWTHVAAVIRFDSLRIDSEIEKKFKPDLGVTCTFESEEKEWDACNVPKGSEGSLQHHTWENPHTHSLSAYTCMIWGDLRDYNNITEIVTYLNRITDEKLVRQLSGVIQVEGGDTIHLVWDEYSKKVVPINLADM